MKMRSQAGLEPQKKKGRCMNMQSMHNGTQLILTYCTVAHTRRVESRLFHLTLPHVNGPLTA